MRRFVVSFFLLLLTIASAFGGYTLAQEEAPATEYAVCDACGYCKNTKIDENDVLTVKTEYIIPESWESCRQCLYPETGNANNPDARETVLINPETGRAPTPAVGSYYTAVGCIATSNFRTFGSASGLVQTLLNVLFGMAGGIAFLYVIYGAITILTSRADPEKLNHGKRIIVGSIIGLVFSLGAVFIINFIANNILQIPGFGQ